MPVASRSTGPDVRTPLIAGNWKCHTTEASARELARGLRTRLDDLDGVDVTICPPFVYLTAVKSEIEGSRIELGAQDVHWQDDVAATGEVGPEMLAELVDYVIIGHSERRRDFGETDETVNRKVQATLASTPPAGKQRLKPIACVGETLQERESGRTKEVLVRQVRRGLSGLDLPMGFIIAYEPVWAIGTGEAATPEMASEAVALIRSEAAEMFGSEKADSLRVLYGGSVDPGNVVEFMSRLEIDGALVGGASLKVDSFAGIVAEARRTKAGA